MFLVSIDAELCVGCGECAKGCPAQILKMDEDKAQVVGDDCLGCESCVTVCSAGAVKVDEY